MTNDDDHQCASERIDAKAAPKTRVRRDARINTKSQTNSMNQASAASSKSQAMVGPRGESARSKPQSRRARAQADVSANANANANTNTNRNVGGSTGASRSIQTRARKPIDIKKPLRDVVRMIMQDPQGAYTQTKNLLKKVGCKTLVAFVIQLVADHQRESSESSVQSHQSKSPWWIVVLNALTPMLPQDLRQPILALFTCVNGLLSTLSPLQLGGVGVLVVSVALTVYEYRHKIDWSLLLEVVQPVLASQFALKPSDMANLWDFALKHSDTVSWTLRAVQTFVFTGSLVPATFQLAST